MKKFLSLALALVMTASLLAGCGGSSSGGSTSGGSSASSGAAAENRAQRAFRHGAAAADARARAGGSV